jgi:hypothetical protein
MVEVGTDFGRKVEGTMLTFVTERDENLIGDEDDDEETDVGISIANIVKEFCVVCH